MRALAQALGTNRLWDEISDTDTLNVGNIAPLSGRLTLGGSATQPDVYIANGHDFQVWGTGAEFRVDGGANAIIGGGGSLQVPAAGAHRIYGGTLSIEVPTTINVPSASGPKLAIQADGSEPIDTLLFQIRDDLANNLFSVDTEGDVTFLGNLYAPGSDIGTLVQPLGTGYFTTINAGAIIGPVSSDGTTFNTWTVNTDASTGTAENVGVMWESSDGIGSIHNWRQLTTTGGREFHLQYKANPTDPKDINEGGYTDLWSCDGVANLMDVYGHLRVGNGVELTARNLLLPATSDSANGVVELGGNPFLHNYNLNTYLGPNAGEFTTASTNLVGVGRDVFSSLTGIASRSVAVGNYALANTTASSFNVAVGYYALNANLTGDRNTALGEAAAAAQTAATDVIAIGYHSLYVNQANGNVGIGSEALVACTTGDENVAIGYRSAYSADVGRDNVSIGYESMYSLTGGHDNVVLGYHALYTATNARDCVAIGTDALELNPTGTGNIAIGRQALGVNAGGTNNTAVGYFAGGSGATGSNNVFLGNEAGRNETGNNKLYISNSSTTTPLIYGDFSSSELTVNADVLRTSAEPFVINYDAVAATGEVAGHVVAAGDGTGNVEAWRTRLIGPTGMLQIEQKTNPTDLSDLVEVGYTQFLTLNPAAPSFTIGVDVLATGLDFGTAVNRLGTVYCTTLDAINIVGTITSCGTTCNAWEVNNDASGVVAEDTGIAFPAGDGANVQNFQYYNNSGAPEMVLRYKQNPTDAGDFSEAGYTTLVSYALTRVVFGINVDANLGLDVSGGALTVDANGIDCAGNIDLNNTLSFDAAGTIDTSGNNDLTVDVGTADYIVTASNWALLANGNVTTTGTEYDFTTNGIVEAQAGRLVLRASTFVQGDAPLVDLRTSVTDLDVPSGVNFQIGGVALTTANWTAANVSTLLAGPTSNADALHTHSTIIGDGTNANVWQVNEDVVGTVAEQAGTVWLAADGVDVLGWRHRVATSGTLYLEHKTNPVDPSDLLEVWAQFVEYDPAANELISYGNLIFPNGGFIATTNNGSFTINVNGTGNFAVNAANWDLSLLGNVSTTGSTYNFAANGAVDALAGNLTLRASATVFGDATLVDLNTFVTSLDVPGGVNFLINGAALTTANFTAPNVDTLLDGSNADSLHVHSAASISTNTANFNGILSAADTTVQAALETIDEVRHIGAAAPAVPYDGQFWYDNSSGERILYVYDSSRSKWLSSSEFTLGWGIDSGDGELLRGFGITVPQTGTGVLIPKDATIVRITCRQVAGPNPKRFDILVNGASAFNWNTAANVYKNNTANIDLSEDDNVWIEVDSADIGSQDVAIVLWLAWRG